MSCFKNEKNQIYKEDSEYESKRKMLARNIQIKKEKQAMKYHRKHTGRN
jgi:hypothetical protein